MKPRGATPCTASSVLVEARRRPVPLTHRPGAVSARPMATDCPSPPSRSSEEPHSVHLCQRTTPLDATRASPPSAGRGACQRTTTTGRFSLPTRHGEGAASNLAPLSFVRALRDTTPLSHLIAGWAQYEPACRGRSAHRRVAGAASSLAPRSPDPALCNPTRPAHPPRRPKAVHAGTGLTKWRDPRSAHLRP